jgi:hypothetical protein
MKVKLLKKVRRQYSIIKTTEEDGNIFFTIKDHVLFRGTQNPINYKTFDGAMERLIFEIKCDNHRIGRNRLEQKVWYN